MGVTTPRPPRRDGRGGTLVGALALAGYLVLGANGG